MDEIIIAKSSLSQMTLTSLRQDAKTQPNARTILEEIEKEYKEPIIKKAGPGGNRWCSECKTYNCQIIKHLKKIYRVENMDQRQKKNEME